MIVMFKHGKFVKRYKSIKDASKNEDLTQELIRSLIISGNENKGRSFDFAIAGVNYA